MKIICTIDDTMEPNKSPIRIMNNGDLSDLVIIEVDGKTYKVAGRELIRAVENCMKVY